MKQYTFKEKLKAVGPGILVVGAFIGPGTITSATRAGAIYGYQLLWTIVFSIIAVIIMQGMSARLGIVTKNGLAEALVKDLEKKPFAKYFMITLVATAITLGGISYMGGDLTGVAVGVSQLTGIPTNIIAPIWGLLVLAIVNIKDAVKKLEKLLAVCVSIMGFVFVISAIIAKPDIKEIFLGVIPIVPKGSIITCAALIGTTVVPYNMFIHAISAKKTWTSPEQIPLSKFDVVVSMTIGGIITSAVMITAATVMRGMTVNSAADMAIQLEPVLGAFATPFLSIGLIAAGISVSTISPLGVSYVLSGLFNWKMDRSDKRFLATNFVVIITGVIISATGLNPITIIMMAQTVNGIFLPVIVFTVVFLTSRASVMGEYKNKPISNILGACVFIISLIIGLSSIISLF